MDIEAAIKIIEELKLAQAAFNEWNNRLNESMELLRREMGDAAVQETIDTFGLLMKANPLLFTEFTKAEHPYRFAHNYITNMTGTDFISGLNG